MYVYMYVYSVGGLKLLVYAASATSVSGLKLLVYTSYWRHEGLLAAIGRPEGL